VALFDWPSKDEIAWTRRAKNHRCIVPNVKILPYSAYVWFLFFLRKAYVWFLPVCSVNLGEEHFKCDKIIRWIRRKKKHVNLIAAVMLM
jgi:hypothetical protein